MSKKIIDHLDMVYRDHLEKPEYKALRRHAGLIGRASYLGLALGGSTGRHICTKHSTRLPGDLDFITDSQEVAWKFVFGVCRQFEKYKHHGRIYTQHGTDWCPDGTVSHYHLTSTIHMKMCIMVLHPETLNVWYTDSGICVQQYDDIVAAAARLSKRDGKPRLCTGNEEEEDETEDEPFGSITSPRLKRYGTRGTK